MDFLQTIEFTGKISIDQTGSFPVTSSRGSKYFMVLYNHDSNAILAEPLKSHNKCKLLRATTVLHQHLTFCGLKPTYQMIDIKFPTSLKTILRTYIVSFQLVPPHLHCTNATERAIQTYKDHFIA